MRVPLAVLADYANVTIDGKLNIMGIFDVIIAHTLPTVHPQMQLVTRFEVEPAERGKTKQIEIKLLDADGKALLAREVSLELPEDIPLGTSIPRIAVLNMIQFEKYGDYAFHVLVNDETKATIPFRVIPLPAQQGA